jgi:hypothetical protein
MKVPCLTFKNYFAGNNEDESLFCFRLPVVVHVEG